MFIKCIQEAVKPGNEMDLVTLHKRKKKSKSKPAHYMK